jgi:hypothetical protein
MSHKIQTQQICIAIRIAAASSDRFEPQSPVTVIDSYDDESYEFWSFGFPTGMGEKLSIQSCTCTCCGNYLVSPIGELLAKSASCSCEHGFNSEDKCGKYKEMNKWDGFDAFVEMMLPDGERDRLCEDVVGEIMRFL